MSRQSLRRPSDVLTATAFAVAITAPGLVTAFRTTPPDFRYENRAVATRPSLPHNTAGWTDFPRAFEAYYNDFFGFRQTLNRIHQVAWFRVFGMSPHDLVVVGKEGSLFVATEVADARRERPLSSAGLALRARVLQERHDWLAAQGIKYLVVLVPNKATVYPELLPAWVRPMHPQGPAEQLYGYLRRHTTVPVIYPADALAEAKKVRATHPRTDCHWNDYGAYVGYRETIRKLAEWFPGLESIPESRCLIEERPAAGDCSFIMGLPDLPEVAEMRTFMRPIKRGFDGLEDWGGIVDQTAWSMTYDHSLPRAVILHDSFMTAQKAFLAPHFQTACFRWVYGGFDCSAVETLKPHVVIQELVERQICKDFIENPVAVSDPGSGRAAARPALVTRPVDNDRR